jgi:hypothetical protein
LIRVSDPSPKSQYQDENRPLDNVDKSVKKTGVLEQVGVDAWKKAVGGGVMAITWDTEFMQSAVSVTVNVTVKVPEDV